jgi:sec-independent protein translocase protein TatA
MPFGIGIWELLILLVVLLLVFGAKRLPEMGRSLGKGMREFKEGVSGIEREYKDAAGGFDTTQPQPPPAELPSATSEPATSYGEVEPATSETERVS